MDACTPSSMIASRVFSSPPNSAPATNQPYQSCKMQAKCNTTRKHEAYLPPSNQVKNRTSQFTAPVSCKPQHTNHSPCKTNPAKPFLYPISPTSQHNQLMQLQTQAITTNANFSLSSKTPDTRQGACKVAAN